MALYKINKTDQLDEVKEKPFKLEKDIQALFERNLERVMGLSLVKSEFTIKNKRIDSLAFDEQSNAFIIIEYKRNKNISVVDQGFTYLSLMLENKADFIIEYNEKLNKSLKRNDVDWSQTRVVFVSPSFTDNQILATNFKDIAIELWEVRRYANDTVSIKEIKKTSSAESVKPVTQKNKDLKQVVDEIRVYTEDDHRERSSEEIFELYEQFRDAIQNLSPEIEVDPKKVYIALKKDKNIACFDLQKKKMKIYIGAKFGTLMDEKGIAKDVSNIGHFGTGDYEIHVSDDSNLEYILSLVKQVL
jgi:predicted transport protein